MDKIDRLYREQRDIWSDHNGPKQNVTRTLPRRLDQAATSQRRCLKAPRIGCGCEQLAGCVGGATLGAGGRVTAHGHRGWT
jgi:hypothetical protein